MSYGLKYYFDDKKIVGSTTTTYRFEILEDGYSGSSTQWTGVQIQRQYEEADFRQISNIQKSTCSGIVRVEGSTQRTAIEAIGASEIGDYKVQLKKGGTVIWTGLVVPDLTTIGEENYNNQTASIMAKDIFLTGDYTMTTLIPDTRGSEKAIVLIADILDTLGYGLDITSYTSWTEDSVTEIDDILNQSYHEKERLRIYGRTEGQDDKALTNEQALLYLLKTYGLILRQVNGTWNLIQITAFETPSAVRRYIYDSSGSQTSDEVDYQLGSTTTGSDLYVLGATTNNYYAGVKKVKTKFQHDSIIQGIKFNREYWITDGSEIAKSQFWQADGTGNLELFFVTWFAKTTDTNLGNPIVAEVTIYVDTGTTDYYWNGSAWVTSPASINVEVEEVYSTTDSDGNYLYKNNGLSIVTDPIPDAADGTLKVEITPDALQPNYAYWYLRSVDFNLAYSDEVEGTTEAIDYELVQTKNYSAEYDIGTYYFGDGPTSASLSALKDSSDSLLTLWKRYGDASTVTHQELLLNEYLNVMRNQRRNLRATLYGEYEPDVLIVYDAKNFFFLGGSWDSQTYQWTTNFIELDVETGTDTLNTFYITDGGASSSGAVGSTSGTVGTGGTYLEKSQNLADVVSASSARSNLGLGSSDDVVFNTVDTGQGANELYAMDQDVQQGDSPTFGGLTINGNVTISGTVDGRDVSDDGADLDELYTTIGLSALTSHEVDQIENIGELITISNTQWTYLGELDQSLTTNTDVQFDDITATGIIYVDNIDTEGITWNVSTQVWDATPSEYFNNPVFIGTSLDVDNALLVDDFVEVGTNLDVGGNTTLGGTLNVSGNATLGGTADISSNTTIGGSLTLSGSADFNSTMNLQGNLTTQANLADDGYSEGWSGTNWKINADGSAEFEEMRIRGALRVFEFIAKQISTIGGSEILSIAQGRVVSAGSGEIEIENVTGSAGNSFKAGDLWICQVVDINNDLESGGTGSIVKSVRGLVDSVSGNDLTVTVESGSLNDLEQGDLIVGYGNTSDADRQAIMYRNVDRSEDNLIMRLQTGVNDFSKLQAEANTRVAFGDLNGYSGLITETFGFFAGSNSAGHILATSSGLFLKDGSTTLAELTSNTFKVGDGTNFLSFDGTDLDIQTDTFTLETTNLSIDSSNEIITLGSTDSVTLGKKLNLSASDDVGYRDSLNKYANTIDFYGLYLNPENYFGFVEDDDGNIADGYNFRVGGETSNYIEVNGGSGDVAMNFDTFTLDATDASGGIKIDSANELIQLEDANRVRTQIDVNNGAPTVSPTSEINDTTNNAFDKDASYTTSSFQVTNGDSIRVKVTAQLIDISTLDAGDNFQFEVRLLSSSSSGGSYSQVGSTVISELFNGTDEFNSDTVTFSYHTYGNEYFKVQVSAQSVDADPADDPQFQTTLIDVDSFPSVTRVSLDGVFIQNNDLQYAQFTRTKNELSGQIFLKNLPDSDPSFAGQLYRDSSGNLKVSLG